MIRLIELSSGVPLKPTFLILCLVFYNVFFRKISIQVLITEHAYATFWPRTGVLQGSILSPSLYSIYINSLPILLCEVLMPVSSHMYSSMPRREYEGLWINCLLYAVDVVLIAAPEVIPRLLKKAEEHSVSLVYHWNLAKCVVFNSPSICGARRLQRYGSPISNADSLCILVYLLISRSYRH